MTAPGRPLRILYLITDLEIGGTERVVERLAKALDPARFAVRVVALKGEGPVGRSLVAAGVPVLNLRMRGAFDGFRLAGLAGEIRRFRPDVLHAFLFHANVAGRLIGRLCGVRTIISSIRTLEGGRFHAPLERLTWGLGDKVVCVSGEVKRHAARRLGISRAEVIGNGVSEPDAKDRPVEWQMATASRLADGKGVETFIRAAKLVSDALPDARFAVIGSGPRLADLAEMAKREGLGGRLHFVGTVDDVGAALRRCRVFVHASELGEGMPNAVLEAMMAGVPAVATAAGTQGVIEDGRTGFIVPVRDPAAVADRVLRLLRDPALAGEMAGRALDEARRRFSLAEMVRLHASLYSGA